MVEAIVLVIDSVCAGDYKRGDHDGSYVLIHCGHNIIVSEQYSCTGNQVDDDNIDYISAVTEI